MAYKVTITYAGVTQDTDALVAPVMRIYKPNDAYIDTPAYSGTVYDTNVPGWGELPIPEPYASTSIPFPVSLAQFKLAVVGNPVVFTVDDYKEAFYYQQVGAAMADQGFAVEVAAV
jgi:hypothetical protein